MLYLVISEPRPEPPSGVSASRQRFWTWIEPLVAAGRVRSVHARLGRGAVVLFDVASHEMLHGFLNDWSDIIPARFDLYPLLDPAAARQYLQQQGGPSVEGRDTAS